MLSSSRSSLLSLRASKSVALQCLCRHYSSSSAAAVEADRTIRQGPRHDWSKPQIKSIYDSPVLDLLFHGVCSYSLFTPLCLILTFSCSIATTMTFLFYIFRHKFIDMLITSGKCSSVLYFPSRLVGVLRIVHIVLNLQNIIPA